MEMASFLEEDTLVVSQCWVEHCVKVHLGEIYEVPITLRAHWINSVLRVREGV